MKKLAKTKLSLRSETVRALAENTLQEVHGGYTGLACGGDYTSKCSQTICSYWPCSIKSLQLGAC